MVNRKETCQTDIIPGSDMLRAKLVQSCLTLCDPMDCSLPGSSVHGIFQARIMEWIGSPLKRYNIKGVPWWVQWLDAFTAMGLGSIPGQGPQIPRAT